MDQSQSFELPKPSEKLAYKFILDTLQEESAPPPAEETATAVVDLPNEPYVPLPLPPDKNYFRIGEVAQLLSVEPHVLRYWESEFSEIRPVKSGSGQRVYRRRDVETLARVRELLYDEKFSIKGAKKRLLDEKRAKARDPEGAARPVQKEVLKKLAGELRELISLIKTNPGIEA